MCKRLHLIMAINIGILGGSCNNKESDPYDWYRSGALPESDRSVYVWRFVDDVIELKRNRDAHGGLTWGDLKSSELIKTPLLIFLAPGPERGRIFLGMLLTPRIGSMQEVDLVDLDGRGAVVNIPVEIVGDLGSVTRRVAGGWLQPVDFEYPESAKASLFAFWSAIEDAEWEPLEKRYREWSKRPAFKSGR